MLFRKLVSAWCSFWFCVLLLNLLTIGIFILVIPCIFLYAGLVTFTYGIIILFVIDFLMNKWNLNRLIKWSLYGFFGTMPGLCFALWQHYQTNYLETDSFRVLLLDVDYLTMGMGFFITLVAGIVDDFLQRKPYFLKDWNILGTVGVITIFLIPLICISVLTLLLLISAVK